MSDRSAFQNATTSVSLARRFVLSHLRAVPAEVSEAVAVMVSELATNCVRHALSDFSVSVEQKAGVIRVEVSDSGPGRPTVQAPRPDEPTGRGLRIVDGLSDAWGVSYAPRARGRSATRGSTPVTGKTVWFTIGSPG